MTKRKPERLTFRGVLINSTARTVEDCEVAADDGAGLQDLYRLIGCSMVECVQLDPDTDLWMDEEGMLGDLDAQGFFLMRGMRVPLAGSAVLMGTDGEGGMASIGVSADLVRAAVRFPENWEARNLIAAGYERHRREAAERGAIFIGPTTEDILGSGSKGGEPK